MTIVGFHNSHEQVHPAALLAATQRAEQAGFDAAMCSDHWAPWSVRQGHSGFAWTWLGAALATTGLPLGVVNAPGQRYHPAIIAQAAATLAAMFPGRFWVALGSGENVNEHITGGRWPAKAERDARLRECVAIIRALLDGEEVTHDGLVTVDRAKLWTLPDEKPLLIGPAVTPATARAHADWADGLVTVNQSPEILKQVVQEYRDAGGRGSLTLQVHVSWAPDRGDRPGRGPGPDGRPGVRPAGGVGPGHPRGVRLPRRPTSATRPCAAACWSTTTRRAWPTASASSWPSASTRSTCTRWRRTPRPATRSTTTPHRTATPRSATLDAFVDMAAEHLLPQLKQVTA